MTLAELRAAVWAYLGVPPTDRAYTPARLNRWINDAANELRADVPKGVLQLRGTWTPDGGTGRVYTLATQAVPVLALAAIVELRVGTSTGPRLREFAYEQLQAWGDYGYAITGADEAAVLTTNESVESGAQLVAVYETWPAELTGDNDTPSWLPARFHDVLALLATDIAFAAGDEGSMPRALQARLMDRRAQLLSHQRRRSVDVFVTRQPDTGSAT